MKYKKLVKFIVAIFVFSFIVFGYAESMQQKLDLPKVRSAVLNNGINLFYINDDLPEVTIMLSIGYGKLYEDKTNAGIADLLAETISISGSKKYPGLSLQDEVDKLGGKFSISSSWESTVIYIKVLKRFKKEALNIISDVVKNPNFNKKDFFVARSMQIEKIKRKMDNPAAIAFEKSRSIVFNGRGYGSSVTAKQMAKYSLADVVNSWKKYYVGKNIIIGASAQKSDSSLFGEIKNVFGSIPEGNLRNYSLNYKKLKSSLKQKRGDIYFYEKDIPQATIVAGTIAPDIRNNGRYSLKIMNYILGGGSFNSRLMREIRVQRGLAYSVQSIYRSRRRAGIFLTFVQTQTKSVLQVLNLLKANFLRIESKPVSEKELQWAKKSTSNSFIFNFDSPMAVLENYMDLKYYNLPSNYFANYLPKIKKITSQDILLNSKKMFGNGLIWVVVGKKELKDKLSKFGKVIVIK